MPWWPGHTLCPWHLIFTHDGLRVQRTISLPYKDTSTCCFVKFISAASSLPFSLEANCQLPPVCRGNRVFCASRRESEGPTFFAEILSILCWECCWLLHPGLVWVIVPGRERHAAGASCSSQPGFGWIIKKFTRQVETKVLAHSWLLSPFPHWLDHTSYITSWSGLPCQWRQDTMC